MLAAAATTRGARRNGGCFELFEVLEHADHRVARGRVRLVGDRATEADAKLRAELRFDQAISTEGFLRIVVIEISFTAGGSDPHGGESCGTAAWLRRPEFLDRYTQPLTNQRDGRQGD